MAFFDCQSGGTLNGLTLLASKYDMSTRSYTYTSTGDYNYYICVMGAAYSAGTLSSLSVSGGEIITNFIGDYTGNAVIALVKLSSGDTVTINFSGTDRRTFLFYGVN